MTTVDATMPALVEAALRAAIRAPSVHNTRPWRFVTGPSRIEVHLDRDRVLAVADRDAREARISCGAALFNLWLALRAAGRGAVVDLLPDAARPDFLATVRIAGEQVAGPELRALAAVIDHLQVDNPACQVELRRWTVARTNRDDGVSVSAGGDTVLDQVRAGQALQRGLLTAAMAGFERMEVLVRCGS